MHASNSWRIHLRYMRYLLWEFRWPLGVFWTLVLLGGLVMHLWHHRDGHSLSYAEACYGVFLLIFLEGYLSFPDQVFLQPLFFLLPVFGLGAVADSVVRLAFLAFAQRRKIPEWQQMVASLYENHVIVVGIGKVGFRIIKGLLDLHEHVVAIERHSDSLLLDEVLDLDVPVIRGDGRQSKTLEQAGVKKARAVVLATSDDLANLDAALTARDLNPKVRVVLRLFDDTLATKFAGAFSMPAISTARVAAPAFVAAATGRKIYQEFELAGQPVHLVELHLGRTSQLIGRTVGDIQADTHVNIVMHNGPTGVNVNPGHSVVLGEGDTILVIAPIKQLVALEAANVPVLE